MKVLCWLFFAAILTVYNSDGKLSELKYTKLAKNYGKILEAFRARVTLICNNHVFAEPRHQPLLVRYSRWTVSNLDKVRRASAIRSHEVVDGQVVEVDLLARIEARATVELRWLGVFRFGVHRRYHNMRISTKTIFYNAQARKRLGVTFAVREFSGDIGAVQTSFYNRNPILSFIKALYVNSIGRYTSNDIRDAVMSVYEKAYKQALNS